MKKLLCVMMFGMVFGQTKLETRLYDLGNISFIIPIDRKFTVNLSVNLAELFERSFILDKY